MSIKSSFSLLLILVFSQVCCHDLVINKDEKEDINSSEDLYIDLNSRINSTEDSELKKKLREERANISKFFFKGVKITYGVKQADNLPLTLYLSSPKFYCLIAGNDVVIFPSVSSKKKYTPNVHLTYDFGGYANNIDIPYVKENFGGYRICFLYGHSSTSDDNEDKIVNLYFNFLTTPELFHDKKLMFLTLTKSNKASEVRIFESQKPVDKEKTTEDHFSKKKEINFYSCAIDKTEKISFKIGELFVYLTDEGTMDFVFIDDSPYKKKRENDTTITKFLEKNKALKDGNLKCSDNFLDALLSNESRNNYLESSANNKILVV